MLQRILLITGIFLLAIFATQKAHSQELFVGAGIAQIYVIQSEGGEDWPDAPNFVASVLYVKRTNPNYSFGANVLYEKAKGLNSSFDYNSLELSPMFRVHRGNRKLLSVESGITAGFNFGVKSEKYTEKIELISPYLSIPFNTAFDLGRIRTGIFFDFRITEFKADPVIEYRDEKTTQLRASIFLAYRIF